MSAVKFTIKDATLSKKGTKVKLFGVLDPYAKKDGTAGPATFSIYANAEPFVGQGFKASDAVIEKTGATIKVFKGLSGVEISDVEIRFSSVEDQTAPKGKKWFTHLKAGTVNGKKGAFEYKDTPKPKKEQAPETKADYQAPSPGN